MGATHWEWESRTRAAADCDMLQPLWGTVLCRELVPRAEELPRVTKGVRYSLGTRPTHVRELEIKVRVPPRGVVRRW